MSIIGEERTFPKCLADLQPVIKDFAEHFHGKGYEVEVNPRMVGGWDISLTKGGIFKAVLGMRTALKMEVETRLNSTWVRLSVGIFGKEIVPTLISVFLYWPVLIPQIWGIIRQTNLNGEAMREFSTCLDRHAGYMPVPANVAAVPTLAVCSQCHGNLPMKAVFCPSCGAKAV